MMEGVTESVTNILVSAPVRAALLCSTPAEVKGQEKGQGEDEQKQPKMKYHVSTSFNSLNAKPRSSKAQEKNVNYFRYWSPWPICAWKQKNLTTEKIHRNLCCICNLFKSFLPILFPESYSSSGCWDYTSCSSPWWQGRTLLRQFELLYHKGKHIHTRGKSYLIFLCLECKISVTTLDIACPDGWVVEVTDYSLLLNTVCE